MDYSVWVDFISCCIANMALTIMAIIVKLQKITIIKELEDFDFLESVMNKTD